MTQLKSEHITLDDIKKALDLVKQELIPLRRIEYEFGFVEVDITGMPCVIGMNKEGMKLIKELTYHGVSKKNKKVMIDTLYGIEVVVE